jgi:hypothetical protein
VTRRHGHSLAELIVALVIGSGVLATISTLLAAELRLARTATERVARSEGVRVAWSVLAAELRYLDARTDVRALAPDSLALRVLRGVLLPCGGRPREYRYHGVREPQAHKDSLLGLVGGATGAVIEAAPAAEPCTADPDARVLRVESGGDDITHGEPLLLFESGAYHVSGNAVRYRIGGEGRQPLTGEWFGASSRFEPGELPATSRAAFGLTLVPRRFATNHDAGGYVVRLRFQPLSAAFAAASPPAEDPDAQPP